MDITNDKIEFMRRTAKCSIPDRRVTNQDISSTGSCQSDIKLSHSIKDGYFLDWLRDY